MSKRSSIVKALAEKFKDINGSSPYTVNLYNNSYPKLKFWDEVQDFPAVYLTPGSEMREYLPGEFKWGYLGISIKAYCKGDNSQDELESLLADLETCIDSTRVLVYDDQGSETTEILITGITTDEGLLAPYAVGEINLQVRYQVL
jgi:hypothetical protein